MAVSAQKVDARVVNLAGAQGMLSQRWRLHLAPHQASAKVPTRHAGVRAVRFRVDLKDRLRCMC